MLICSLACANHFTVYQYTLNIYNFQLYIYNYTSIDLAKKKNYSIKYVIIDFFVIIVTSNS